MSRAYQSLTVFGKSKPQTGNILWLAARTGFVDVTINGQRFYYNNKQVVQNVNIAQLLANAQANGKKGVIVIRKK